MGTAFCAHQDDSMCHYPGVPLPDEENRERPQKKKLLRYHKSRGANNSEDFHGFDTNENDVTFLDLERNDISYVYYHEGEKVIASKDFPQPRSASAVGTSSPKRA